MSPEKKPEPSRPCPQCEQPLPIARGVCPECGYMTTWFRIRFFGGCAFALFAIAMIFLMLLSALYGLAPTVPEQ